MTTKRERYGADTYGFDRLGKPITAQQWTDLQRDAGYKRVAVTDVPGLPGVHVSTVWLGYDHGWGDYSNPDYRPVIFETMVFGGHCDQHTWRYATVAEARAGHERMVAEVLAEDAAWQRLLADPDVQTHVAAVAGILDAHSEAVGSWLDPDSLWWRVRQDVERTCLDDGHTRTTGVTS